ncbi:MAG: zinc ribbon-containing protein [Gammaproteobacteria bacterium]|nr:zinc ribbon-containing protein [Gammaproteobacteria bacterium]MDX2488314.1 zinc ribbon-containing protein [Gammaproteobacteria bacterium]
MSKENRPNDPLDILGVAYETMLERSATEFRKLEKKTGPALHSLIDNAKAKAVELGEITEDEAAHLAEYLKRDLSDASFYISEHGRELKDWLGFEDSLIAAELLDVFLQAANPTTVEMNELKLELAAQSIYKTGEVTGPGALACDECGEVLHFHKAGRIPPCPKCHKTSYHRQS